MLLSIRELAKTFRTSERHVRRMIAEGHWPSYRLGHRMLRVDLDEIKRLSRLIAEGKPRADNEKGER